MWFLVIVQVNSKNIDPVRSKASKRELFEDLILVQDERWRHALSMQVGRVPTQVGTSRERLSNE